MRKKFIKDGVEHYVSKKHGMSFVYPVDRELQASQPEVIFNPDTGAFAVDLTSKETSGEQAEVNLNSESIQNESEIDDNASFDEVEASEELPEDADKANKKEVESADIPSKPSQSVVSSEETAKSKQVLSGIDSQKVLKRRSAKSSLAKSQTKRKNKIP